MTEPIRLRPDLAVEDAWYEELEDGYWIAFVKVRRRGQRYPDVLMFALSPGYSPREDGGEEAAEEIRQYFEREHN